MTIVTNPRKKPSARIWPSRDFTLGYSLQGLEDVFHVPTVVIDGDPIALGLSNRPKSHNRDLAELQKEVKRSRRGANGITPHGKLLVKNAAAYLEKVYGRSRLSFLTLTLPSVTVEESRELARQWAEIVRKYLQELRRKLIRNQLPPLLVGVSEIQQKRFQETGVVALHLHIVFVGRHPKGGWMAQPDWFRETWQSCFPVEFQDKSFKSVENVVRVKRSVAAYLSKYLSKGLRCKGKETEVEEIKDCLPTCWYNCTNELRSHVKRLVLSGEAASQAAAMIVEHALPECLEYLFPIYVVIDEYEFLAGWRGKLTKDAYMWIREAALTSATEQFGETFPPQFRVGRFTGF